MARGYGQPARSLSRAGHNRGCAAGPHTHTAYAVGLCIFIDHCNGVLGSRLCIREASIPKPEHGIGTACLPHHVAAERDRLVHAIVHDLVAYAQQPRRLRIVRNFVHRVIVHNRASHLAAERLHLLGIGDEHQEPGRRIVASLVSAVYNSQRCRRKHCTGLLPPEKASG